MEPRETSKTPYTYIKSIHFHPKNCSVLLKTMHLALGIISRLPLVSLSTALSASFVLLLIGVRCFLNGELWPPCTVNLKAFKLWSVEEG